MLSLLLIIGATIAMSRMAEEDRGEGFKWGAITFGLCILCSFIPIPILNIGIACIITWVLMTVTNNRSW